MPVVGSHRRTLWGLAFGSVLVAACSDDALPPDLGVADLGPAPDVGSLDAAAPDASPPDVGTPDAGEPDAAAALSFTGMTPAFGLSAGGGSVVIEGTGFGPDVEARIGGVLLEAATSVAGAEALSGTLPALPNGPASVELRSGGDTVTVADVFLAGAWAPAAGLTGGPARDLALDPNGDGLWLTSDYGLWLRPAGSSVWLDRSGSLDALRVGDIEFEANGTRRFLAGAFDVLRSEDGRTWARVSQGTDNAGFRRLLVTPSNADVQFGLEPSVQALSPGELPVAYTDTAWRFRRRCMANGIDVRPIRPVSDAFFAPADERLVIWIGPRLYLARDAFCLSFEPMDAGLVGGVRGVTKVPAGERLFALIPDGVYSADRPGAVWSSRGRPDPALAGVAAGTDTQVYGWTAPEGRFSVSSDGGRTWTRPVGAPEGISALFVPDATAGQTVYARVGDGLFQSTDAGATWAPLDPAPPLLTVTGLGVDAGREEVVWASSGVGLHRSGDGGATWSLVSTPGPRTAVLSVPGRLYVARADGRVEVSTDGGLTLTESGRVPGLRQLFVGSDGTYALGERHLFREGPSGWTKTATVPVGLRAVAAAFGPTAGLVLLATDAGGVLRSTDSGATWQPAGGVTEGLRMTSLMAAPGDANAIYASGLDGATFMARYIASFDGGFTWRQLDSAPTPASVIAVSPRDTNRVWFGAGFGVFGSTDGGATLTLLNPGTSETPRPATVRNGSVQALLSLSSGRLLLGSDGFGVVYREP